MRTIRYLMLMLLCVVGLAVAPIADTATYTFSSLGGGYSSLPWLIKQTTEPVLSTGATSDSLLWVGGCTGAGCPHSGTETCTKSDGTAWTYLVGGTPTPYVVGFAKYNAGADRTDYYVHFSSPKGKWPGASWPAAIKCEHVIGSDTFRADITIDNTTGTLQEPGTITTISSGVSVDGSHYPSGLATWTLPAGSYTAGCYSATHNDGSAWAGIKCTVSEGGSDPDGVMVQFEHAATAGNGRCQFNKGGVLQTMPIALTR